MDDIDGILEVIGQNQLAVIAMGVILALYGAGEIEERLNRSAPPADIFTAGMDPDTEIVYLEKRLAILRRLKEEDTTIENLIFQLEDENRQLKAQLTELRGA